MKGDDEEEKKDNIMVSDKWFEELKKYPFISSNILCIKRYRETWQRNIPYEAKSKAYEG
jgi:hypothetical protein